MGESHHTLPLQTEVHFAVASAGSNEVISSAWRVQPYWGQASSRK